MLIVYFLYFLIFLYGTLVYFGDFYNDQHWWTDYYWTASNGNKFTNVVEVLEGESIDFNNDLFKKISEGTYVGFYTIKGDDSSKLDDVYTPNGNDMMIYGKFGSQITLMNENNVFQKVLAIYGPEGNQVQNLPNATLGTYTQRGWWTAINGGGTQFTQATKQNTNLTVYAKWVSVITYNNNGAGSKPVNKDVLKGQQITSAGLPALTSAYTWKGWYRENTFKTTVAATWVPTGNTTIYAKWVSVISYNLGVLAPEGYKNQLVSEMEVLKGQKFSIGNDIDGNSILTDDKYISNSQNALICMSTYTLSCYTTSTNWNSAQTYSLNQTITPTGNMNLYAKWVSKVKVYQYNSNSCTYTIYKTYEVVKGQSMQLPDIWTDGSDPQVDDIFYDTPCLFYKRDTNWIYPVLGSKRVGQYNDYYTPTGNISLYGGYGRADGNYKKVGDLIGYTWPLMSIPVA